MGLWFEGGLRPVPSHRYQFLSQYIQIHGCGFHQCLKLVLNVFNDEALLWLPLPAAQHDIIDFLRTDSWAFQDSALSNAFNNLEKKTKNEAKKEINTEEKHPVSDIVKYEQ